VRLDSTGMSTPPVPRVLSLIAPFKKDKAQQAMDKLYEPTMPIRLLREPATPIFAESWAFQGPGRHFYARRARDLTRSLVGSAEREGSSGSPQGRAVATVRLGSILTIGPSTSAAGIISRRGWVAVAISTGLDVVVGGYSSPPMAAKTKKQINRRPTRGDAKKKVVDTLPGAHQCQRLWLDVTKVTPRADVDYDEVQARNFKDTERPGRVVVVGKVGFLHQSPGIRNQPNVWHANRKWSMGVAR
jgi:hypothetical protein